MNHDDLLNTLSGQWVLFNPPEEIPAGSPCEEGCFEYLEDVHELGGGFQYLCLKWSASDGKEVLPCESRAFFAIGLSPSDAADLAEEYDVPSVLVNDDRGLREVCMKPVPSPEKDGEFLYLPGDTIRLLSCGHKNDFTASEARELLFGGSMGPVAASLQGGKKLLDPRVYFVEPPRACYFHTRFRVWPVL